MEDTVRPSRRWSRRRRGFASLLTMLTLVAGSVFVLLAEPGTSSAARTWYVTVDGDDGGTGYFDSPLATIGRAVQRARSGDSIRIGPGTFHESVQVYGEALHLKGAGVGETVLDGARAVTGFVQDTDGRFSAPWHTDFQRTTYDPSVPHVLPERPEAGWPEQFFLDGVPLREVASRSAVAADAFYHDRAANRVVLGDDPTGRLVEGSDLSWGLYFNHADGSSASGLSVNRYATEERHMAAVRAYSDDLSFTDVEVRDNARMGLSIMGDRVDVFRTFAVDNGYMGLHGHRASEVSIRNSQLVGNNREVFDAWHASAGMKITESQGIMFSGNTVSQNHGPGFWTDLDVTDVVVKNNYFRDNHRSGVEIELSSGVIVVDNVSTNNGEQGVWVLESSQVDVWHNYLAGNERGVWVLDGPRGDVNDVTIGNNVLADPSSKGMLLAVDDWTKARNANMMNVSLDGNRYWTSGSATGLLRWSNWPAALTINDTIEQIRSRHGHEADGQAAAGGSNPFPTAQFDGAPVPDRVAGVRSSGAPDPSATPSVEHEAGWTSRVIVRGDSRPVRIGSASPTATGRLTAETLDAPEPDVVTAPVEPQSEPAPEHAPDPAPETENERVVDVEARATAVAVGWRSFAEQLGNLLDVAS